MTGNKLMMAAALVLGVGCGRTERQPPGVAAVGGGADVAGGTAGSAGGDVAPPVGGIGGAETMGGAGGAAGAPGGAAGAPGGAAGVPSGGGGAGPALVALARNLNTSREIAVDAESFYFVSGLTGLPPDSQSMMRVSRSGGSPEVLVGGLGSGPFEPQLYAGNLYYRTPKEVHVYDPKTQRDSVVFAVSPPSNDVIESITSMRTGPAGVYWALQPLRRLFHLGAGSLGAQEITGSDVEIVLRVEQAQLIVRAINGNFMIATFDIATGNKHALAPPQGNEFKPIYTPLPADANWLYRLDGAMLLRFSRSAAPDPGSPFAAPSTLSTFQVPTFPGLFLYQDKLFVRSLNYDWEYVSSADGSTTPSPALKPCSFLFTGNDELFCASTEGDGSIFYQVTPAALHE